MDEQTIITPLLGQARRLQRDAQKLASFQPAIRLSYRLAKAIASADGEALEKPVCVALLGGTGAGKSTLFNAIVREKEASPTSVTRAFTKEPFVAATSDDFAAIAGLGSTGAKHVAFDKPGIALIDTPDVDSVLKTNQAVARKIVETSDIVVYVTTPDKVSNFEVDREIRAWSAQKRWFFVLNKVEHIAAPDLGQLRAQFVSRLEGMGFQPDDSCLFLLSAIDPQLGDFRSLEEAIYSARTVEKVRMLRVDGTLGLLANAISGDLVGPIRDKLKSIGKKEDDLTARVRDAYMEVFTRPEIEEIMRGLVRERTWQALSGRVGWIMGVVVWLKCRWDFSILAWQAGRLLRAAPSPFSLLFLGATAVGAFWRGILPLRKISAAISPETRARLQGIRAECRRELEDEGFSEEDGIAVQGEPEADDARATWMEVAKKIPVVGEAAANALQAVSKTKFYDGELMTPLQDAIEGAARSGAQRSIGWAHQIFANLLPTVVLADAGWRFLKAWIDGNYLPWQFYGVAVAIFVFSLIPGYLLLVTAVNSRAKPPAARQIVDTIQNPAGIAALHSLRILLEAVVKNAESLKENTSRWRAALDEELPTRRFGARLMKGGASAGE